MSRSRLAALLAPLLLAGCYTGPPATADHKPEHYNARMMPLGAAAPAKTSRTGAVDGIFPVRRARAYCCWMGPDGRIGVAVPAHAHAVIVTVFVPDLPVFSRRSQSLAIAVDGGTPRHFAHLPLGISFLRVPIPSAARAHVASIALTAGFTFSPLAEHLNGDARELSIYVKSVRAE